MQKHELPNIKPANTLAEANATIKLLTESVDQHVEKAAKPKAEEMARSLVQAAEGRIAKLQSELQAANARIGELETAASKSGHAKAIARLTGERDMEKAAHAKTAQLLDLAEGALQVRGIPSAQAIPAIPEPLPASSVAAFDARLAAEKDPARRQAIMAEFSKAVKEGQVLSDERN